MKHSLYAQNFSDYIQYATKALSLARKWRSHVKNARVLDGADKLIQMYEIVLDKKKSRQLCMSKVQTILERTYEIVMTC